MCCWSTGQALGWHKAGECQRGYTDPRGEMHPGGKGLFSATMHSLGSFAQGQSAPFLAERETGCTACWRFGEISEFPLLLSYLDLFGFC